MQLIDGKTTREGQSSRVFIMGKGDSFRRAAKANKHEGFSPEGPVFYLSESM
jgi:hypothetical protein